jgi:hypothetical protein
LLGGDVLHPVDYLAVFLLLNGDVRHAGGRRRAMPVLLAGREPDYLTRTDLFDRAAFALSPAAAGRYDERLAERMRVPCSPRTRLKRNVRALN